MRLTRFLPDRAPITLNLQPPVNAPKVKKNSVNAPAALKPLHAWSSVREVCDRAVFVRPGQYRVTIPAGWMRSVEDVHTELALRTTAYLISGNWPTPPAKPTAPAPEPTPEEREESWVRKQIEALGLNRFNWPRLASRERQS